jgi:hypothetical protein
VAGRPYRILSLMIYYDLELALLVVEHIGLLPALPRRRA